jgi:hypothetical protein
LADLLPGGGVHRAGRLIGQQHRRAVDQGAGDSHPLALTSGQPGWVGIAVLGDPELGQQLGAAGASLAPRHAGELGWQQHVVRDGQVLQQVEELEDHPHLGAPVAGQLRLAQAADPLASDDDDAARRLVQPGDQVQQRGFPAAGGTHHRHRLTRRDLQIHVVQGSGAARHVPFGHLVQPDQVRHDPVVRPGRSHRRHRFCDHVVTADRASW